MATLREVREAVFPGAVAIGSPEPARLDATVGWVRVLRARVPAFDTLEAGDLAVVPGRALQVVAPTATERAALVQAFARAGLSGMVVTASEPVASAGPVAPAVPRAATAAPATTPDASSMPKAPSTARADGSATAPSNATAAGAAAAASADGATGAVSSEVTDGVDARPHTRPESPDVALAEAVAAAGLPVFRLVGADPGALERSLIGFLVNRRAELELQAGRLEERLQALALGDADLPALVAEVGAYLGRAVALEGRRGDRLAVHAGADDPTAAAAVGRYLGSGSAALRVPLPAARERAGSLEVRAVAGWLVLLGDRPPTELERIVAGRIAGALALELARDEAVRRARDTARPEALPADGPPWVVLVARQVRPGETPTIEGREETRRELRLLAPARRLALRGTAESLELRAVLAGGSGDPAALLLAERIASFLGRTVAVSRPFLAPPGRPAAEAEARATLEATEALGALDPGWAPPAVARGDRLAAFRLLGALHNVPDGSRLARSLLAPLLDGRPGAVRERLATLRAVLDHPGPAEAAAALGIHRNTLAYRIRRIEGLTGWRLTDPGLRLPLSAAVRLVQDAQD